MKLSRIALTVLMGLSLCMVWAGTALAQDSSGQPQGSYQAAVPAAPGQDPSADQQAARPFRPENFLAPFSRFRWGPFALYGADFSSAYSNRPILGKGEQFSRQLDLFRGSEVLLRGSATMGFVQRRPHGTLAVQYTPSFFRQESLSQSGVTHNLNMRYGREFGRDWELGFSVQGGTYNQYSFLLQEPVVAPIARLQAPLTNRDLLNILDQPEPLAETTRDFLLTGRRVMRSNAALSLTHRLSPRDTLVFSGAYGLNRGLGEDTEQGLPNVRQANYRSLSVGFHHALSPRNQLGLRFADRHISSKGGSNGSQQSLQVSYGWLPAPKWSVFLAGGPALRRSSRDSRLTAALNASVARTAASTVVAFAFSRDFYFAELPGGHQSDVVHFTWAPRPRGRKWMYSISSGYQWIRNDAGNYRVAYGWVIRPAIFFPISNSVQAYAQYVFFNQHWGRGMVTGNLSNFQRHMVMIGFRWHSFGGAQAF